MYSVSAVQLEIGMPRLSKRADDQSSDSGKVGCCRLKLSSTPLTARGGRGGCVEGCQILAAYAREWRGGSRLVPTGALLLD